MNIDQVPLTALSPETRREILSQLDRRAINALISRANPEAPRHWLTRKEIEWLTAHPNHTTITVTVS